MSTFVPWFLAFAFTQAVEVPIYRRARASFSTAFLASTLTHPLVWFVFPLLPLDYWPMVACAETFAVLAEALWLRVRGVPHPLPWSLLANTSSFCLGLLSRHLFDVP